MRISETKKIVLLNTLVQLSARVFSSFSTFIVSLVIAKKLGIEVFGDFSKVVSFVPLFYVLTDLGINASFLRIKNSFKNLELADLITLRLLLGFLGVFFALASLLVLPRGVSQGYTQLVQSGIMVFSISILFQGIITSCNAWFQHKLTYYKSSVSVVLGSSFTLVSVLFFAGDFFTSLITLLVGTIITATISLFYVSKETTLHLRFNKNNLLILLKDAAPLSITLFFNVLYFRVDTIILTLFRSTTEVGVYNLAYKFFELPLVIPVFFTNSLFPFLLKNKNTPVVYKNIIIKSGLLLFLLGVLLSSFFWITAPYISLLHADFSQSAPLLRILSLSFPVFFLSNLILWIMISKSMHKSIVIIYGISLLLNIVLNIVFIPFLGATAAAYTTILGEIIVLILGLIAISSKLL